MLALLITIVYMIYCERCKEIDNLNRFYAQPIFTFLLCYFLSIARSLTNNWDSIHPVIAAFAFVGVILFWISLINYFIFLKKLPKKEK